MQHPKTLKCEWKSNVKIEGWTFAFIVCHVKYVQKKGGSCGLKFTGKLTEITSVHFCINI